jgi:uncharacterized protein YcfJ
VPRDRQQRFRDAVMKRLEAPDLLAIDVQGRRVTMASSNSGQVSFDADGRALTEQSRNGKMQRTTTTLSGNRLTVSTTGDRAIDYQVTFDVIDNGRSLRVTRSITDEDLNRPIVAKSVYDRISNAAEWDFRSRDRNGRGGGPPANVAHAANVAVPQETEFTATLNDDLNTSQAREGDRFSLTVQSPASYRAAVIEGHVARSQRSGQVAGRAEMALNFDRIRLQGGRSADFDGYIESVRTVKGETVNVNNEGRVADSSQTNRTVERTGVGAAIGAVIGAIAGGGKGAAIGAAVGAGAGAGSVFVQGRDDLDLVGGTEFRIRATAP